MRGWAVLLVVLALAVAAEAGHGPVLANRTFDGPRAYRDLVQQCDFGPRVPGTEAHAQCAQWLAQQLYSAADGIVRQEFTAEVKGKQLPLTNIVADFNPVGRRRILLCAHWDSRPAADCDPHLANRNRPIAGANDGASGVAVLLEIARALKRRPPKQRVTIVLFDGEDYGPGANNMFLGSRFFARHWTDPPPAWAVLLDMVADRDLRLPMEALSQQKAPAVVDRIWGAAERAGASAFVREHGPYVFDDHVFLLAKGIPCIDVIDFDYPHWHTLADTPDKCAPASLEQVGKALLRAIAEDEADCSSGAS